MLKDSIALYFLGPILNGDIIEKKYVIGIESHIIRTVCACIKSGKLKIDKKTGNKNKEIVVKFLEDGIEQYSKLSIEQYPHFIVEYRERLKKEENMYLATSDVIEATTKEYEHIKNTYIKELKELKDANKKLKSEKKIVDQHIKQTMKKRL